MSLTTVEIRSFSGPSVVDMDGSGEPSIVYINQGPAGVSGTITTSTSTNLIGFIYGNGTNIAGATAASSAATANTLVLRDSLNAAYFSSVYGSSGSTVSGSFSSISGIGSRSSSSLGTGAVSSSISGTYHHKFGEVGDNQSAVERVRGWFVWFFESFIGRLKTANITDNREWTLPNASGFVALTTNANGAVTNSEVYAKAAVPITAGQAVYISGASGANKIISLAQANTDPLSSKTLGLSLQNLSTNAFGYVVTEGDLSGLSINLGSGHGVTEGDPIWLSPTTPGGLLYGSANKPSAPNHLVFIGVVTRITGNTLTDIFVKVQNGFELDELHNVAISSEQNGQVLTYESSTQLWKNKATYTAKSTTGNPATGIEGEICINTFDNNVKIYAEGGWRQIAAW